MPARIDPNSGAASQPGGWAVGGLRPESVEADSAAEAVASQIQDDPAGPGAYIAEYVEPAEPTERGELFAACEAPVQRESAVAARISKPPYLPGGHTAAAVISYLDAHPEERAAVISAERAGKNRKRVTEA